MIEFIFYFSVISILYVYVMYPVLIFGLSKCVARADYSLIGYDNLPELTIIIPLFNESSLIEKKIEDFRSINYPSDKIKYIFVSDGSTDASNSILSTLELSDSNITVIYVEQRMGKPNAINLAMNMVTTDVVVFSDIRQTVSKDSIINIVSQLLSDDKIGVVCGELVHLNHEGSTSENVGIYWKYEKWIRHSESDFMSTVGTTGALYAIHKSDFSNINIDTILDDFEIPMKILLMGKRLKISKNSYIYDVAHEDIEKEKTRKIRTLSGNYQSFSRMKWLFSPVKNPVFIQFISHKFLRLIVPYLMFLALVSNFFLAGQSWLFALFLGVQISFYLLVALAKNFQVFKNNKFSNFCLVFFELNMSVIYGLYKYVNKSSSVTWNKT